MNNWEKPGLQLMEEGFMCEYCRTVVTESTYADHLAKDHPDKLPHLS